MKLQVTATGMVSSVGWDADTSAASVRAGITRGSELDVKIYDPDEDTLLPIIGRPIAGLRQGFISIALWTHLSLKALEDLKTSAVKRSITNLWENAGVIAIIPNDSLRWGNYWGDEDTPPVAPDQIRNRFLIPLLNAAKATVPPTNTLVINEGQTGLINACIETHHWLSTDRVERVILLAVDSYIDANLLQTLAEADRLKSGGNATGFTPGEAAACCLLEQETPDVMNHQKPLIKITSAISGIEPESLLNSEQSQSKTMSQLWQKLLQKKTLPFNGTAYIDLNGEYWRSMAFGFLRTRMNQYLGDKILFNTPAESLGDIGSATGLVAIILFSKSIERGYEQGKEAYVLLSAEDGKTGIIEIEQISSNCQEFHNDQ